MGGGVSGCGAVKVIRGALVFRQNVQKRPWEVKEVAGSDRYGGRKLQKV